MAILPPEFASPTDTIVEMYPFKIGTFITVLAIFLVGEFAVVKYGPQSPARRNRMIQDLPVIKQVRQWQYRSDVRQNFSSLEDGILTWSFRDKSRTWNDVEALLAEADAGSWEAASAINSLSMDAELRRGYDNLQRDARSGDLFSMIDYHVAAIHLKERADSSEAASMLAAHPSASAKVALIFRDPEFDWASKEGMLLQAQVARESLRHPKVSESSYRNSFNYNKKLLATLRDNASNGDADSQWVVERLAVTPVWHQPVAQNR